MIKPLFPTIDTHNRLAIISEHATANDDKVGEPFTGLPGQFLSSGLSQAKAMRSACYLGALTLHPPPQDRVSNLSWDGTELKSGLARLKEDLFKVQPNCVLLTGDACLTAAGIRHPVSDYRGTVFVCDKPDSPFYKLKCCATINPKDIQKNWDLLPLFYFDVGRAVHQSTFSDHRPPKRNLIIDLSPGDIVARLRAIPKNTLISFDIEGGVKQGVTCIGVSTNPQTGFIIPLQDYNAATKVLVMREFMRIMESPDYPKVLQNELYDNFVLGWTHKFPIVNACHDTMVSGWEIYPELPKALGVQASIWTDQPFYKFERKSGDTATYYRYCCTDACVTLELHQAHMTNLETKPEAKKHYEFNMSLMPALNYMQFKGIRYDKRGNNERLNEIKSAMSELQSMAEHNAGCAININSPKQMVDLLYHKLNLEPQYAVVAGRKTTTLTADSEALLRLAIKFRHPFVLNALNWRKLEGVRKQLSLVTDYDGRMRCRYNLVGSETGRLACYKSETGSGTNLQTIMESLRMFYLADEDHFFFQCDLSGADGWTVAVRAAELGDPTMLDDYFAGIKPAKVIAAMAVADETYDSNITGSLNARGVSNLSRSELKAYIKSIEIPDTLYNVSKAVQHGSNYMMGPNTMSKNIMEKSFKKSEGDLLYVPPNKCKQIQNLYFLRYPGVLAWHDAVAIKLKRTRQITSASGHTRMFFGRVEDRETVKIALAQEPQNNTTYATNLAMLNLWNDPTNRNHNNSLIIQPLHSVHDALCGQFPQSLADIAAEKIRSYFNNPILIGKHEITIPYEGGYGHSWYHTKEHNRVGAI